MYCVHTCSSICVLFVLILCMCITLQFFSLFYMYMLPCVTSVVSEGRVIPLPMQCLLKRLVLLLYSCASVCLYMSMLAFYCYLVFACTYMCSVCVFVLASSVSYCHVLSSLVLDTHTHTHVCIVFPLQSFYSFLSFSIVCVCVL